MKTVETLCLALALSVSFGAGAQSIEGPNTPCIGQPTAYKLCLTQNFPYNWGWSVNNGASVVDMGTDGVSCYLATVTPGASAFFLTFSQSNPPGLPQPANITKYAVPRRCN